MESIYFLAADETLKEEIEAVLRQASVAEQKNYIPTKVAVLDFPNRFEQGRHLVEQGAQVIITHTGPYYELSQAIRDIPVLCLHYSTSDILYTLHQVENYEKSTCFSASMSFSTRLCAGRKSAVRWSFIPIVPISPLRRWEPWPMPFRNHQVRLSSAVWSCRFLRTHGCQSFPLRPVNRPSCRPTSTPMTWYF